MLRVHAMKASEEKARPVSLAPDAPATAPANGRDDDASRRGLFLVLEGLDGAGTTTQTKLLLSRLEEAGHRAEPTREPTTGPLGGVIRLAIEKRLELDPRSLALAFAADRVDHYHNPINGIARRLASGVHVVSDRYALSSLAYQALDADIGWLAEINVHAPPPDRTYFLRVSAETAWRRVTNRSVVADELFHAPERLRRVAELYEEALVLWKRRCPVLVLDGEQSVEEISEIIWEDLQKAAWKKR